MQLPADLTALQDLLLKIPQQKLAKAISALLVCYIAYLCSQLTWLFLAEQPSLANLAIPTAPLQKDSNTQSIDLSAFKQLNLFGVFSEQKKVAHVKVQDAPETKLNLTLTGTVASDDASIAAAIIENNNKQETYGIGDKITGTSATLDSVSTDRVLIKQAGRIETLMLDGFIYNKASSQQHVEEPVSRRNPRESRKSEPEILDQRNNQELSQSALQLKNDINEDPGKIADHLKIVPKREGGNIVGYQLMPGRNPDFFQASGLQPGDVAVQMNGLDLTIPSEAAQALQALKEDTELSLLVERDGTTTEILFSIQ